MLKTFRDAVRSVQAFSVPFIVALVFVPLLQTSTSSSTSLTTGLHMGNENVPAVSKPSAKQQIAVHRDRSASLPLPTTKPKRVALLIACMYRGHEHYQELRQTRRDVLKLKRLFISGCYSTNLRAHRSFLHCSCILLAWCCVQMCTIMTLLTSLSCSMMASILSRQRRTSYVQKFCRV